MVSKGMGTPEVLKHDRWLSGILGKDSYSIVLDDKLMNHLRDPKSDVSKKLRVIMISGPVFIYCKVPTKDIMRTDFLQKAGFRLVDSNLIFEKVVNCFAVSGKNRIRFAEPDDAAEVHSLARSSFLYSRFHLDPAIPDETANRLKGEWAGNYFKGLRGESMIISEDSDRINGFLQLLIDGKDSITIDLIAVEKTCRSRNIASDLIAMAESENRDCGIIRVGTQIANIPSIRLYEKLGFRLKQSQYIFHYHG